MRYLQRCAWFFGLLFLIPPGLWGCSESPCEGLGGGMQWALPCKPSEPEDSGSDGGNTKDTANETPPEFPKGVAESSGDEPEKPVSQTVQLLRIEGDGNTRPIHYLAGITQPNAPNEAQKPLSKCGQRHP